MVRFRPEAPYADLAHLVERHLAKVEVASSSLVIRSNFLSTSRENFSINYKANSYLNFKLRNLSFGAFLLGGLVMRTLFVIDKKDYNENGTAFVRPSVRGIIQKDGKYALIHSLKYDYYKFPGGGAEKGEDHTATLCREVLEESGLVVIPSSVREYGLVHRVQKGFDSDMFIQDNYYYFCDAEKEIQPQRLEHNEAEEQFVLEFVTLKDAIEANERHDHGEKAGSERFECIIQRETGVMHMLEKEGGKKRFSPLLLTFIPYAAILLYGLFCAVHGIEFWGTAYGFDGFFLGVMFFSIYLSPLLVVCLIIQLACLARQISFFKRINKKKFAIAVGVICAVAVAVIALIYFSPEIETMAEKHRAKSMLKKSDEVISYNESYQRVDGILGIEEITNDSILIDYDKKKIGFLMYNDYDEYIEYELEECENNTITRIAQQYDVQAVVPLDSPGITLTAYTREAGYKHMTAALVLETRDGVYYKEKLDKDGDGAYEFLGLKDSDFSVYDDEEYRAQRMLKYCDVTIPYNKDEQVGGIFGRGDITSDTILIDYSDDYGYSTRKVGFLMNNGEDEYLEYDLSQCSKTTFEGIKQQFKVQAVVPLDSPGVNLTTYTSGGENSDLTAAVVLSTEDGVFCATKLYVSAADQFLDLKDCEYYVYSESN